MMRGGFIVGLVLGIVLTVGLILQAQTGWIALAALLGTPLPCAGADLDGRTWDEEPSGGES